MDIKDKLLSCRGTNISWAPAVQMDLKGVVDLLERRGSIYSGRPHFAMVGELYVSYWLVSVPYCRWRFNRFPAIASDGLSPRLRALRKVLNAEIGMKHADDYKPLMERKVVKFLKKLLDRPQDFVAHNRWWACWSFSKDSPLPMCEQDYCQPHHADQL